MKKKVFSLMMTLLLAFMGVAKADVVTIGEGTSTTYYCPFNSLYGYSFVEEIYTAAEVGMAGNITSISFDLSQSYTSEQTNNVVLYMKNVSRTSFSSGSDWETVTTGDIVYQGTWTIPANYTGWMTITLDTPFAYDGTSNLMIAMHESTSGYSTRYVHYTSTSNAVFTAHSDSYDPDPYNLGSYSGTKAVNGNRANIQLEITAGGGAGTPATLLVHDGTATNGNVPVYGFYADAYLKCEMVYPAAELSAMNGGTINAITFYATSPATEAWTSTWQVFVSEVADATISSFYGPGTVVYEGALDGTGNEMTINFTTPYQYNGGNLLVGIYNTTTGNYKSVTWAGETVSGASVQGYSYSDLGSISATQRNFLPKTNFDYVTAGGGAGTGEQIFAVQDGEVVDVVNVGPRPNGCWMEPFTFQIRNTGAATTISHLDWTPQEYFTLVAPELPAPIAGEDLDVQLTTGTSTNTEWQMVALYGTGRTAAIWTMIAEPYDPAIPDVWEMAYDFGTINAGFSYQGIPSQITPTTLHNDYTLPFPEIEEGEDAVYKFTVASDMIINAYVDENAENGKVALYTEDFNGQGGPMADNNYTGLAAGGAAAAPFEVQIGEGTSNNGYLPFYCFYNYSLSQQLFTAAELEEAGVTGADMTSLSWNCAATNGNLQSNITIWMANVEETAIGSTTMLTNDMAKVYEGNMTPAVGWNEFVFNQGTFAWDGHSNVLISVQRNNGAWASGINWYYTAQNFTCSGYKYTDSQGAGYGPFDMTTNAYSWSSTTTNRANIIMKAEARREALVVNAGPVIENLAIAPGTYYLVASATQADYDVFINVDDMPCPAINADGFAFNPQPADDEDEVEPNSVTLRWQNPEYATGWRLIFGTTYYPDPNHPQTVMYPADGSFTDHQMSNSYTVRNLWNNTNYFWRVEFNNDACPDGVSSPIWGFTTHLNVPQNLTAVDETVFNDETIVLNWNAVQDRTYRKYNVYRDGEFIGSTQTNNISNTTYTDGPLAYNMGGYVYYVTAVYDEGESAPSNTVTVKVSGRGNVNGHVFEQDGIAGIAGATVTMVGRDEFNVAHTYNFQTNAQGYYSGAVYAGSYDGQASCNGYQTIDEPVQGNPINITYNVTTSPVDYILDENFDPVCTVIAEYYPDSLDPNSPYVKVYWGCGLPGEEIVEPFETGDFSLFDWQIDPTYPWSITTYQPYEGTYCMKSGGAGVANVVSNMSVTVDIPADGIMSFFGKISSENNWDYGYFYIDGVQKGSYTGAGSWGEKKFDIAAGTHTFKWSYTKDGSVNSNDDCFYVDYITFYKRPEPAQPGWHTYCESEFNNAVGSNLTTTPSWAYEYPANFLHSNYAGWNITKVSLFSDNMYSAVGGNYTCRIYVGGTQPAAGTMVSTITVDVPSNQNAWVDWDLTTPVNVTGNDPIWVVWTANSTVSSWPAGCCGDLNDLGTWWDGGSGWEHLTYGTWTMRHWFTNRAGRSVAVGSADNVYNAIADANPINSKLRNFAKGEESNDAICANPNAVKGAAIATDGNRSFNHYRIYRTNCYNDGPYTEENTVLLATNWPGDTVYIDVEWADLDPGVYKWGVGCVYVGNRGEEIAAPINWAAPVTITRDATAENDPNPVMGEEGNRAPWDLLNSFNGTSGYQYGVATDGNYIYTCSWSASSTSQFYKYDMDGNFVEEFNVSGSGQIRDLTYDGQYFYGVANSTTIYCLDLASHSLVSTVTSGFGAAQRGITYDPQRDGFWVVGNWSGNLTLVSRTGAVQFTGPAPTSASGLAYYKDEDDVEHIYCFNNGDNGVYDYNITTNTMGGSVFNFNSLPGATGTSGGCHVAEYNGKVAFFGDIQQSPQLIGIYELKDAAPAPGPTPGGNNPVQEERESEIVWSNCLDKDMFLTDGAVTVNVLLNSADNPEGSTVDFVNYNEAEQELYPIDQVVIDESGFYAFESFRRGIYQVTVQHEGYETVIDSVNIWNPIDLRYVLIEIIYGVSDLYVSSTGWAMWGAMGAPVGPTPGPGGNGDTFDENFDSGMPTGWTTLDADGDGYTWVSSMTPGVYHNSGVNLSGTGHNASEAYVISGSYANGLGYALTPDNYLVSPQVNLVNGSTFSFWACAQDASWAAEHFGVAVSSTGTGDWTMVNEWTMTAKANGAMSYGRNGETRAQGNWYNYTVDLSAYAGQKYIAIRHFNCTDMFILNVDDIALTTGAKNADAERHLESFKVLCTSIDGEPIYNANVPADQPFCQLATDELVAGEHYICKVASIYSTGMSGWTEQEWQYIPCENYAGTVNGVTIEGNEISWEYPGGGPVPPQPGQGDEFTVDFESGIPAGWTTIDGGSPQGYGWHLASTTMGTGYGHNGSSDCVISQSYDNNYGVIYPDNYLVSPQVNLASGSTFSFYACAQDASYASEHFGVFVSDNGTSNWTMVEEWTMTAKGSGVETIGRDGRQTRQGNWYQKTVDLSAFAGQKYIAIRHFNCSDMFYLDVDDVELSNGAKANRAAWDLMMTFTAPEGGHYGVAYDGSNFYTSNWGYSSAAYNFYQYDLSGNMIEGFNISGCGTLRGMTYDGTYFYGVANSSTVYCVDLAAHSVVSTFTSSYGAMRGITYDPERDGFWVIGNWSGNLTLIDRTGAIQQTGPAPTSASDLAYYKDENDVEHIYCFNNGTNDVEDWVIGNPAVGGSVFNFSAVPGFASGSSGGCTVGSFNGKIAFIGDIQQSPNLIGVYELRDDTNPGPGPGPTPTGDVLGAMIFADGEWEAFVEYPTNTYTYEGTAEEVCVRIVYNGTNTLPEGNIYFSMSCPECEPYMPGTITCEMPYDINIAQEGEMSLKVWWGNEPAAPVEEWLYYDDGANVDAIGLTNGGTFYWGIKFPASSLAAYEGCSVTKVAYYDYTAHSGVVSIYQGSAGNGPSNNMVGSYNYTANGTDDWVEWNINPASFDNTQDLWIVMSNTGGGQYVASMGNYTGDPNGTMISTDGSTWYTLDDATGGAISGTWNLRCFVSNQAKGVVEAVEMPLPSVEGGELANAGIAKGGSFNLNRDRASLVKYNVYRSTEAAGEYAYIGSVNEDNSGYYEYIDTPADAGTYYYQVRAEYDNDCESEPALAADGSGNNYVSGTTAGDGVSENGMAIYPNPTKGNVTIEVAGMRHITVVSTLGQVVFDADIEGDNYIMNMSQYTAGMYTVRVITENGVNVSRITVVK